MRKKLHDGAINAIQGPQAREPAIRWECQSRTQALATRSPVQQRLVLITPGDVSQPHRTRLSDNRYDIRDIAGSEASAYRQLDALEQTAPSPFFLQPF